MSESKLLVAGAGKYVDDIKLPNMLYMAVARSPYAHARVLSVQGGLNRADLPMKVGSVGEGGWAGQVNPAVIQPVFAQDTVNYVGQPVAAVFADDRYVAEDKLDEVHVEYEKLKPVMTIDDALSSEPIHAGTKSNVVRQSWLGEDFKDPSSPVVLEDEFNIGRIINNPLEPRGILADYDGDKLTVYVSTQAVFSIKDGLVGTLKLDASKVRVIQADTGGAFGLKSALYPEYIIAAYAAMKYKRPVKWIESRTENFAASQPGRGVRGKMKIFAERDGVVTAWRGEITVDAGAFGGTAGTSSPVFIAMQLTGPYGVKKAHVLATSVMTNKPPQGPYRGAGRPEAAFFRERMMDLLADELGKEAAEVRLINATTESFKSPLGLEIEASRPFFEKAVVELKYPEKSRREKAGIGFFVLLSALWGGESAKITVKAGKVDVWLGGNQHGQEHYVFVKKLLNEELGIQEDRVTLNRGDSDMLEDGMGAWGSRSAIVAGAALIAAARKLKKQLESDQGSYTSEKLLKGNYSAEVMEDQNRQLNAFGAVLATVAVDKYGMVKVKECAGCYDVGRALNAKMIESQIIGGSMQGIGQVLYEGVDYDADGNLLTKNLFDAGLPAAENIPKFTVKVVENPSWMPHHVRGLGEAPTIGVPAALARAIEKVTGKRIRHTPVKPEELIE
ncbi:MAG TPA: xanthine dehydrogenase family protein molybdopterin-binding subunit [Candidatus Limnocylindrales bacterium]|nr:xanthine dehydrogenase family protein molybdopterin-binding subunit [Candidatus Limnocylindrales bacterium]